MIIIVFIKICEYYSLVYSHIFAPGLGLFYKVRRFDPKGQCCEGSFVLHPSQRVAAGDLNRKELGRREWGLMIYVLDCFRLFLLMIYHDF
jgi:hypothetical protein